MLIAVVVYGLWKHRLDETPFVFLLLQYRLTEAIHIFKALMLEDSLCLSSTGMLP